MRARKPPTKSTTGSNTTIIVGAAALAVAAAVGVGIRAYASLTKPTDASRARSTGQHVRGLDFKADLSGRGVESLKPDTAQRSIAPISRTQTAARPQTPALTPGQRAVMGSFADALVAGRMGDAYNMLSKTDHKRTDLLGFTREVEAMPVWKAAQLSANGQLDVTREPVLDLEFGLVTAHSTVKIPVVTETGRPALIWSERVETSQLDTNDNNVSKAATDWVLRRRECQKGTDSAELLGVIGLATSLCNSTGQTAVATTTQQLLDLDDPAPVLDAYGSAANEWARVVAVESPVPMNLVLAPVADNHGNDWTVIALARPTLQQQRAASS